jgi:hypothetical protein
MDAGQAAQALTAEAPQRGASAGVQAGTGAADSPGEGMAVPEFEPTGHAEVDAALDRLRELAERPTGAHPDLYDGVHQRLQDVLAQIDRQDVPGGQG